MMLALAVPAGLRTLRLREDVRRDVVLIRRHGDDARPVVEAMTAVIDEIVSATVAPREIVPHPQGPPVGR
jgi:hypothetical protein